MTPPPLMTEKQLLTRVREICAWMHLLVYHTHNSRRSEPGYPDLTIAGPGGVMWRELKTRRGKVTPDQITWLQQLAAGGGDADIWRPVDLLSGRIQRELTALRRPKDQR